MQTPAQDIAYVENLELPDEPDGARLESTPVEFGPCSTVPARTPAARSASSASSMPTPRAVRRVVRATTAGSV